MARFKKVKGGRRFLNEVTRLISAGMDPMRGISTKVFAKPRLNCGSG